MATDMRSEISILYFEVVKIQNKNNTVIEPIKNVYEY